MAKSPIFCLPISNSHFGFQQNLFFRLHKNHAKGLSYMKEEVKKIDCFKQGIFCIILQSDYLFSVTF